MNAFLWLTAIVLVIILFGFVMFFLIRDTDRYYAAFKGVLIILAGTVGGNAIQPYIEGKASIDFRLDDILKIQSPELVIKINPPDRENKDKSSSIYSMTGLAGICLLSMLFNEKFRP